MGASTHTCIGIIPIWRTNVYKLYIYATACLFFFERCVYGLLFDGVSWNRIVGRSMCIYVESRFVFVSNLNKSASLLYVDQARFHEYFVHRKW